MVRKEIDILRERVKLLNDAVMWAEAVVDSAKEYKRRDSDVLVDRAKLHSLKIRLDVLKPAPREGEL